MCYWHLVRLHLLILASEPVHRVSLACNSDGCLVNTSMKAYARHCKMQGTTCNPFKHGVGLKEQYGGEVAVWSRAVWTRMQSTVWVKSRMDHLNQKAADARLTFHTAHLSLNHNVRKVIITMTL